MISLFEIQQGKNYIIPNQPITDVENKFVVHEHHADKAGLHYDLRLGHDNLLLSFATRKLPQILNNPKQKIILFKQPDHDPSWIGFQGTIDDGYGKGKVDIYDSGSFNIEKWEDEKMILEFHGSKLTGKYIIYHLPNLPENQFLMFAGKR